MSCVAAWKSNQAVEGMLSQTLCVWTLILATVTHIIASRRFQGHDGRNHLFERPRLHATRSTPLSGTPAAVISGTRLTSAWPLIIITLIFTAADSCLVRPHRVCFLPHALLVLARRGRRDLVHPGYYATGPLVNARSRIAVEGHRCRPTGCANRGAARCAVPDEVAHCRQ